MIEGITLPGYPSLDNVRRLDISIIPMVRRIERNGMQIDIPGMQGLSAKFDGNMARIDEQISGMLPSSFLEKFTQSSFNVDSSEQVAELLFDALGVGKGKQLKTTPGGKRISTSRKQLELLSGEHPIIPLILEYRTNAKLKSTYSVKLARMAVLHHKGKNCSQCGRRHYTDEWRLHPEITTTRTGTGRMACKNPPLQTIPVRSELGREIRAMFVAGEGRRMVNADMSQIELRILAHCAIEQSMIEVFQAGGDIHTATAMDVFDLERGDVDAIKHRLPAKTINFAVCLAGGQQVLTNHGLIPIERLSRCDLLWDGVEWVHHEGVIYKGWQEVIYHDGVWATPEHRTWLSTGGVLPISEALAGGRLLAVTACEDRPVRYGFDPVGETVAEGWLSVCRGWLLRLWEGMGHYYRQHLVRETAVLSLPIQPEVSKQPAGQKVDGKVLGNETALRTTKLPWLRGLWWKRNREPLLVHRRVRKLHPNGVATPDIQASGYREDRQRWTLRARELRTPGSWQEQQEHPQKCVGGVQRGEDCSGGSIRQDEAGLPTVQSVRGKDKSSSLPGGSVAGYPDEKAKRSLSSKETGATSIFAPVYDVVGAGPRHRFTIEGKLVSNCYGLSGRGLQLDMALSKLYWSLEQCDKFIESWFAKRPGVRSYMDEQHYHARRYGYIWELGGRIRHVPEVRSSISKVVEAGLRQAGNHRIQGTAATLMKLTMIEMTQIQNEIWDPAHFDAEPLMTIHDELIYEVDEDEAETVGKTISRVMDGCVELRVPVRSDWKVGKRWKKE